MPGKNIDYNSNVVVVNGIQRMEDVIAKLTLCWLEKLFLAGLTLNPHECNLLPLLELVLKVITSGSVEEPMRGSLVTRNSGRGVVINLPFLLDFIVECFEFNFGPDVFAFMEFVVSCPDPREVGSLSTGSYDDDVRKIKHVCILMDDIYTTHILSSTQSLTQTRRDLLLCGIDIRKYQPSPGDLFKCIDELSNWLNLDSVASRRSYRYDAQVQFTRLVAMMETDLVDSNDPTINDTLRRLITYKDIFRQALISRVVSSLHDSTANVCGFQNA